MNIVLHPLNKSVTYRQLKYEYSVSDVFNYKEMLDAHQMMQEAAEADAEMQAKQQARTNK